MAVRHGPWWIQTVKMRHVRSTVGKIRRDRIRNTELTKLAKLQDRITPQKLNGMEIYDGKKWNICRNQRKIYDINNTYESREEVWDL